MEKSAKSQYELLADIHCIDFSIQSFFLSFTCVFIQTSFNNHFNLVRVTVYLRLNPGTQGMWWEQSINETPVLTSEQKKKRKKDLHLWIRIGIHYHNTDSPD